MKKKKIEVYKIIGILGLHRSSGVTHLTLLMAQYLRGCLGHKVTVLEKSGRFDLRSLAQYYSLCDKWEEGFILHGIQFLIKDNVTINNNIKEECILIDFGTNYQSVIELQDKLDILIYVFTNAPWYQAVDLLWRYKKEDNIQLKKAAICNMATKKSLNHSLKSPIKPSILGLEPDFFNPSVEAIRLFESVLLL